MRRKRKLELDLGELNGESKSLSNFSCSKLKTDIASKGKKLLVGSETVTSKELMRIVNKFVYHRNLNNKFWVRLEGDVVKIYKFKHHRQKEMHGKKGTIPSTIKHGW